MTDLLLVLTYLWQVSQHTSVASHAVPSGDDPRDATDPTNQAVLAVVYPATFGGSYCVDGRRLVTGSGKFVGG